jgi:MFS family permease
VRHDGPSEWEPEIVSSSSQDLRVPPALTAWRTILAFGVVSLAGDMVYEGMRSVSGPLLASLGASALVVGLVTGAGEAAALVLRLAFGPLADRTGRHWFLAILGYSMTAVCVPLLAFTPFLGAAGLAVASVLIILERTGKAVRSPAKSTLLAHAAGSVGRGRGFGVHKVLDQTGAVAGPLLVAAVTAVTSALWPGMAILAIPGGVAVALLLWTRRRVPDVPVFDQPGIAPPPSGDPEHGVVTTSAPGGDRLTGSFYLFATACALATAGLMTYGVISFHLVEAELVSVGWVPVVYALAMVMVAVSALATGYAYDRWHARVLYLLPLLVAAAATMVFTDRLATVLAGVVVWGMAAGVQDSTVKALVADLVVRSRLATAYGVFATFQGVAALAGGAIAGAMYEQHVTALVAGMAASQVAALALLIRVLR